MNRRQFLGFVLFPAAIAGILALLFFVANISVFKSASLESPDARVRMLAVQRAGHAKDRAALETIRKLLAKDPAPSVRVAAAEAIFRIAGPASGPDLVPVLDDADPHVRQFACYALGAFKHAPAAGGLRKRLADDQPGVRWAAAVALAHMGDRAALPVLHACIAPPAPRGLGERASVLVPGAPVPAPPAGKDEQMNALLGIGWLADPSSIEPLEKFIQRDDIEPDVKKLAKEKLANLRGAPGLN